MLFLTSLVSLTVFSLSSIFTCASRHWRKQVLFRFSITRNRKLTLLLMKEFPFGIGRRAALESKKMGESLYLLQRGRALYCTIAWSSQVKIDSVFPAPNTQWWVWSFQKCCRTTVGNGLVRRAICVGIHKIFYFYIIFDCLNPYFSDGIRKLFLIRWLYCIGLILELLGRFC